MDTATTGISTLPYTTLFRSEWLGQQLLSVRILRQLREVQPRDNGQVGRQITEGRQLRGPSQRNALQRDRKSTRLNSSHVRTSYAVFCLKKKKDTKIATVVLV